MILPKLKKYKSEDPASNEFQATLREYTGSINALFLKGSLLTETANGVETDLISLSATPKTFEHKLGEKINGFLVLDQRAAQVIFRVTPAAGEDETRVIVLQAGGAVSAKVWVF